MFEAPLPKNEAERLYALQSYELLDTFPEKDYDDIVVLASQICQTSIALITLVDKDRQWFKAKVGLDINETERKYAFCSHAILESDIMEVRNTAKDERFFDNPLVQADPEIVFYAGAPLSTPEGYNLGTICVIDKQEKSLNDSQKKALKTLANQVMKLLELRLKNKQLEEKNEKLEHYKEYQNKVLALISHDLRSPLVKTYGMVELLEDQLELSGEVAMLVKDLRQDIKSALDMLDNTLTWAKMQRNGFAVQKKNISLQEIVEKIVESFQFRVKRKNIDLTVEITQNMQAFTDKFIFSSIIRNLLSNALKFTPENGKVQLQIYLKEDKRIHISVSDTGIGMSQELIEKFMVDAPIISRRGTQGEKGSGVGLQILREFTQMLGGSIVVESQESKGSVFLVSLPNS